jgi:hypothetical protein
MFHQGDLQSGIQAAIASNKLVACFICSDDEESRKWEQEWLGVGTSPAPIQVFTRKAVILRIEHGSQEMGFLSAFCPVANSPTFVIIDRGRVVDKVESGVGQEEFMTRVNKALGLDMDVVNKEEYRKASAGEPSPEHKEPASSTTLHESPSTTAVGSSSDTFSNATQPASQDGMGSLFPDRAERLEAEKAQREAAEKAERTARANARRKEAEEAAAMHGKGKEKASDNPAKEKSRRDWMAQQKQRNDEAKQERQRILAQIQADKEERRARSQKGPPSMPPESPLPPSADAASRRMMGAGGMCSLQIRLFDGSSIKGRFEPSATLATVVRDWIKTTTAEQGNTNAADIPFTFKQLVPPQPSRSIEISEEHQSLVELGLIPSATLVLAPVAGYTEAYSGHAGRGYISAALHMTYGLASGATGLLGSALSYVPGFGGPEPPADSSSTPTSHESSTVSLDGSSDGPGSSKLRMKTLADQRAEAQRQDKSPEFYNGNSSAFEGRKNEDEGKK